MKKLIKVIVLILAVFGFIFLGLNVSAEEIIFETVENIEENNEEKKEDDIEVVSVLGSILSYNLVSSVLGNVSYDGVFYVVDEDDNIITEFIDRPSYLVVENEDSISKYLITFMYDYNGDYIFDYADLEYMINNLSSFSLSDIDYVRYVLDSGSYEVEVSNEEVVVENSANNDLIIQGDEVIVSYEVSSDANIISMFDGEILYDDTILELENISVDNEVVYSSIEDNYFCYFLDNSNNNFVVNFKFKAINNGEVSINLNNLSFFMNGSKLKLNEFGEVKLEVLYPAKGGDIVSEIVNNSSNNMPSNDKNVIFLENKLGTDSSVVVEEIEYKSNNCNISFLGVDGYFLDFNKDILKYNLSVDNNVSNLNFNVILDDSSAKYMILGNDELHDGINNIYVIVSASDGSNKVYEVVVNKKEEDPIIVGETIDDVLWEDDVPLASHGTKLGNFSLVYIFMIIFVFVSLVGYIYFSRKEHNPVWD